MKPPGFFRAFNYRKTLLPNEHLASLEEGVTALDEAQVKTGQTVGYPAWNLLYYCTLSHLAPESENIIVETGTNFGCSTIILAQALKDSARKGHVYSVEIEEANHNKAKDNINKAGVSEYVSLFRSDSVEFLKRFVKDVNTIRIAFLDGCHEQDHLVKEFELVYPKLTDESLVFFDNTYKIADEGEDQRVNGGLKIIKKRYGGNLVNFENTSWFTPGLAIWQRHAFRKDWE